MLLHATSTARAEDVQAAVERSVPVPVHFVPSLFCCCLTEGPVKAGWALGKGSAQGLFEGTRLYTD